jgi:hypothetical protein
MIWGTPSVYVYASTTALGAGAVLRSPWRRVLPEPAPLGQLDIPMRLPFVYVRVLSNVNSNTNGVYIEYSADQSTVAGRSNGLTYQAANGLQGYLFSAAFPYIRIVYENGATPQAIFLIAAWLLPEAVPANLYDPTPKVGIADGSNPNLLAKVDSTGRLLVDAASATPPAEDFEILNVSLPDNITEVVVTFSTAVDSLVIQSRNGFDIQVRRTAGGNYWTLRASQSLALRMFGSNSIVRLKSTNATGDIAEIIGIRRA